MNTIRSLFLTCLTITCVGQNLKPIFNEALVRDFTHSENFEELILSAGDRIYQLNRKSGDTIRVIQDSSTIDINKIALIKDNSTLVYTNRKSQVFIRNFERNVVRLIYKAENPITTLTTDEKRIYLGTQGGKLIILNLDARTDEIGVSKNVITSIVLQKDLVLFGDLSGNLTLISDESLSTASVPGAIFACNFLGSNKIILGTSKGMVELAYNEDGFVETYNKKIQSGWVTTISTLNDNTYSYGTSSGKIMIQTLFSLYSEKANFSILKMVSFLEEGKIKLLVLGKESGLYELNAEKMKIKVH